MQAGLRLENLSTRDVGPIDLVVAPGEYIGLSGASGSGKTLLLRAIADLDPHAGRVYLDGVECNDVSGSEWRRRIGLMPAEGRWWYERVGEHFVDIDPQWLMALGFSPEVMQREVVYLSSGERQRLTLLRLLSRHPRTLLLDEPTANLDHTGAARVEGLIRSYVERYRVPVIWVGHDREQVARMAERRFALNNGSLQPLSDL